MRVFSLAAALVLSSVLGCGSGDGVVSVADEGDGGDVTLSPDGGRLNQPPPGGRDGAADGTSASGDGASEGGGTSNVKHVVIVVQENHSFDAYFGRWCTAPSGSSPSCNAGPSCCEGAPAKDPSGASPAVLDDAENAKYDPNHTASCETDEMNGGKMDRYVTGASCSNAGNFAIADAAAVKPYHDWATQYALADRYFQPLVGASTSNDMYFAVAKYVFTDNQYFPNSNGHGCDVPPTATIEYTGQTTLADVFTKAGRTLAFYAEGYQAMLDTSFCPLPPSDCPEHVPTPPCVYDPSDNPFEYYDQLKDNRTYEKDLAQLAQDVGAGTLPDVSFVKLVQYHNEHPGYGTTISTGAAQVQKVVDTVLGAPAYAQDTLVLVTWDEGGGFFDHVPPPPQSLVDGKPYGTRVPLLALGRFARKGYVSHVTMEHSSVVRFLEWNFLHATGQLQARDAAVANIGSMLDPAETGVAVPEN